MEEYNDYHHQSEAELARRLVVRENERRAIVLGHIFDVAKLHRGEKELTLRQRQDHIEGHTAEQVFYQVQVNGLMRAATFTSTQLTAQTRERGFYFKQYIEKLGLNNIAQIKRTLTQILEESESPYQQIQDIAEDIGTVIVVLKLDVFSGRGEEGVSRLTAVEETKKNIMKPLDYLMDHLLRSQKEPPLIFNDIEETEVDSSIVVTATRIFDQIIDMYPDADGYLSDENFNLILGRFMVNEIDFNRVVHLYREVIQNQESYAEISKILLNYDLSINENLLSILLTISGMSPPDRSRIIQAKEQFHALMPDGTTINSLEEVWAEARKKNQLISQSELDELSNE